MVECSRNQLNGVIPPELGNLSNLSGLILGYSEFSGEIPVELNNLANLVRLSLSANQFTGCMSDYLRDLTADLLPECVTADNSDDTEALIALYDAWDEPDLENWLSRDPLGDWKGVSVDHQGRVVRLQLPGDGLSGNLPPELGDLTQLSWVDLSYNDFGGQIPPEWGKLSELRTLLLDSNRLSGEIPTELTNLTQLRGLSLSDNEFGGEISDHLGHLKSLMWMDLSRNDFDGELPTDFAKACEHDRTISL